jgi:hypothetical protein
MIQPYNGQLKRYFINNILENLKIPVLSDQALKALRVISPMCNRAQKEFFYGKIA